MKIAQSTMTRNPDGTIIITMTIPWAQIQKAYDEVVEDSVKNAEMPGFRKGKAPRAMVESSLDKQKTYEETIKRLVPHAYQHAVEDLKVTPIIIPDIQLKEAVEGKDWVVEAKTCERPTVSLGDYKAAVHALFSEKKSKIVLPGQASTATDKNDKKPTTDEILTAIASHITVTIPDILLDHEVQNQLSQLVDQTKKLGLTVEQYLASTNRTADSIRNEYKSTAAKNLSLEFGLDQIAEKEGVIVNDEDIDTVLNNVKSPEEKKVLQSQRYYIASVLRRQKTLDSLTPKIV